jgi:hypothetical protein
VSPSFVINLMTAFRKRGAIAPKALGGWRHSKLDPHRVFILRRVAEKDDISMGRARRGRLNDGPRCAPSPIGWCFPWNCKAFWQHGPTDIEHFSGSDIASWAYYCF